MTTITMKKANGWFTTEIQQMMFSFGDSRQPLQETAELVEVIVHQQIIALLEQASEVATSRREKQIGIENIIFLLRKDKNKLKRLFRFFEKRDMKNKVQTLATPEDDSDISVLENEAVYKQTMSKDRQICLDFLCSVDQTGELLALFYDKDEDTVKHERMLRAEIRAQGMSTKQYFEFCKARQAGFGSFKKQFREWIMLSFEPVTVLSTAVMEVLCYLAHETIAQIVDFALLVKQDLQACPGEPQIVRAALDTSSTSQICTPHTSITDMQTSAALTPSKLNRKKSGSPADTEMSWDCAILPSDVREAMRRYYTDISPFVSQTKVNRHCSIWYRTLCS